MEKSIIHHIFFIISTLLLVFSLLIMMIKYHDSPRWERKVWICSKILTLKNIIKLNNVDLYPILNISIDDVITKYQLNYESLLKHSGKDCEINYKKCGILDSLGNIMCIPNNEECPINDIIIDLQSEQEKYFAQGYKAGYISIIDSDKYLYYTNNKTENPIVVKLYNSSEFPTFINENNFIFDEDSYYEYREYCLIYPDHDICNDYFDYGYDPPDYDDYHYDYLLNKNNTKFKKGLRKRNLQEIFYKDNYTTAYIKKRFNETINKDSTYRNISDNIYVGNYIGFNNTDDLKEFNNFDLYFLYFTFFPNANYIACCYITVIPCLIALIVYLSKLINKNCFCGENDFGGFFCSLRVIYFFVYTGFFGYILNDYIDIYKDNKAYNLIKIKADPFLGDLLEEIHGRHLEYGLMLTLFISFLCSFPLYILSIIFWVHWQSKINSESIEKVEKKQNADCLVDENQNK